MNESQRQLETLLAQTALSVPRFTTNSRYHATPTGTVRANDGRATVYLRRRFVPQPERFATLREHQVAQGDRIDVLAASHLGDPELFWRLCDANRAIRPAELTESIGRRIRVTLPDGVPGSDDA